MSLEIKPVRTWLDRRTFLTFPWKIYRDDPLWVPPLLPEVAKTIDPKRGKFFQDGMAEFFIARRDGKPVGTMALAEDFNRSRSRQTREAMLGFLEFIEDRQVFNAMMDFAVQWARQHGMSAVYGTYNLDREERRGVLLEGYDRPPVIMCGHQPPYYHTFLEDYGFQKCHEDGLAYAIDIDLESPQIKRLLRLAERVQQRHPEYRVRGARRSEMDAEIDRIVYLQNEGLKHFPDHIPYTRRDIEAMVLPLVDLVDLDLVLLAEADGQPAGFFPGVPNFNEITIHLNGLRYPWDYLRLLRYKNLQPKCIAIKSVVVPPQYWDTGLAVLMFAEMVKRAAARGYTWADLSITGEENTDTWPLAHHMGAKIYKRYRFYTKSV